MSKPDRKFHDDSREVKALLQQRIESLCRDLFPDGKRHGKYWMPRNPSRDDSHPGSFFIGMTGVPGAWSDRATDQKGDIFGLIDLRFGFSKFSDTMRWARDWLGLSQLEPAERARIADEAMTRAKRQKATNTALEADKLARKRRQALGRWLKCNPVLEGTPVDRYLATRGIDIRALATPPKALRSYPDAVYAETGELMPAMAACMTGPDGEMWAVHMTFLQPDGSGKALVEAPRKMWPSYVGASIRLSRGVTGLRPDDATKKGLSDTLVLCEGIEDGLSLALACPELRVWAVGCLHNLAHQTIPGCSRDVIVAADNDWGKPQAEKMLERALEKLRDQVRARGGALRVARSHIGKDVNDALLGKAA